jgi:hypothetical protein
MKPSYKSKFFIVLGASIILYSIPLLYVSTLYTMMQPDKLNNLDTNSIFLNPNLPYLIVPFVLAAIYCFIWSCYIIAKGKGYTGWLSLLALSNIIGLVILVILPNKFDKKKIS